MCDGAASSVPPDVEDLAVLAACAPATFYPCTLAGLLAWAKSSPLNLCSWIAVTVHRERAIPKDSLAVPQLDPLKVAMRIGRAPAGPSLGKPLVGSKASGL